MIKIIFNRILPFKPYAAMALGNIIFVRRNIKVTPRLMAHELVHVDQYKRLGMLRFLLTWIFEYVTKGYWNISLEKEAYAKEKDQEYLSRAEELLRQKGLL